jgi:hypothetical protein
VGFFIDSSLLAGRGSGRNQPNDFFTVFVVIGKPGVDHEKDRPGANLAERDVAIFFLVMGKVTNGNGIGVVENQFSRLEIDAMVGKVLLALPLVALETHGFVPPFQDNSVYV